MVRAKAKHIARDVRTVMRCPERMDVRGFGIEPRRHCQLEVADLATICVCRLDGYR